MFTLPILAIPLLQPVPDLPHVRLTADDTRITHSCIIDIDPGLVIADANADGVIHIDADDVAITFSPGSELRGAAPDTPWDTLTGIGIRLDAHTNVRVENARVHGFKVGLLASHADGFALISGDFSDNYRQHLKSTPKAEDSSDWLFPHHNDDRKWRDEYGAAVCLEETANATIAGIRVRHGQNGIILDRVTGSRVFDNDCSFLSGWGLAMWRSSDNVITRNLFDFCVRGHSEGVYNRGQDSAGILVFEQCNANVFAENSATHGGDCFFAFAGRESIGEIWRDAERERLRRETGKDDADALIHPPDALVGQLSGTGCNHNLIVANDLSYAPAHGLELTFSEHNTIARNRLVQNAICGIWGGYSSDTLIAENIIEGNGGMSYGQERGGINMEHAADNRILYNSFTDNRCDIHLWWNDNPGLASLPGVADRGIVGNIIAGNTFASDDALPFTLRDGERLTVLHLRDPSATHIKDNLYLENRLNLANPRSVEFDVPAGAEPSRTGAIPAYEIRRYPVFGRQKALGARKPLRGRDNIIMGEWGPWDHEEQMVRMRSPDASSRVYEVFGVNQIDFPQTPSPGGIKMHTDMSRPAHTIRLTADPGVHAYTIPLVFDGTPHELNGVIIAAAWNATFFSWTDATDPRTNLESWRALAAAPEAFNVPHLPSLDLPYAHGGPRDQPFAKEHRDKAPGPDHFGMIATTTLNLPKGRWKFSTLSDDGVRVLVNNKPLIENWTWHAPTRDSAAFDQPDDAPIKIQVEHFEIDGYAVLELSIEPE